MDRPTEDQAKRVLPSSRGSTGDGGGAGDCDVPPVSSSLRAKRQAELLVVVEKLRAGLAEIEANVAGKKFAGRDLWMVRKALDRLEGRVRERTPWTS